MENDLSGKTFVHYRSGVYEGKFTFGAEKLEWCAVDLQTRVELKRIPFEEQMKDSLFDFQKLHDSLGDYAGADWSGNTVTLPGGKRYNRYWPIGGLIGGHFVMSHIWAQRGEPPVMDVVTLDGKVIAFVMPGRISSEVLALEGYEAVTPIDKYSDPMLSKAEYGIRPLGNLWVTTRDGVKLATEVFLPEGGPESPESLKSQRNRKGPKGQVRKSRKFPAIVIRTCYGKSRDLYRTTHWVNRGYALVIQDVRGRSDSDGELVPFYYERDDAYDLFSWIASQEWSDGNIGMWGASYLGYTTTAAATSGHPNLKTAISEVNVGSPFFMDTVRRGGAVCSWPLLCWTLAQSVSNRVDHGVFRGQTVDPDKAVKIRPITEIPTEVIGKRSGPWDIWAKHYRYDEFWEHCDNTAHGKNVKIPMLILSGWHDGDALGVQETWRFLTENDAPGRHIIIGPWPHGLNAFRDCLDTAYGDDAIDYDFDTRTIRWFDRYLKGIKNGEDEKPRATYYVGGAGENRWHYSDDWSPVESTLTELYFHSGGKANSMHGDGRLLTSPPDDHAFDTYVYDPENTARSEGEFEPVVLNANQSRQDCLVYDSPVLTEPVAVAGNISTVFYASSSAVDTDFFVSVSDVDEKGVARQISQNGIRAEFRNWPEVPSALLTPGKIERYHIYLHFAGHVFEPGHKIRVDVCSADYITFFPNTNTGVDPYTDPDPVIAVQKIHHGEDYPSCIRLPILYGKI